MKTYVVGVGLSNFVKPRDLFGYEEMGLEAAVKALVDSGLTYDDVEAAYTAYCYGDSTCGQRVLYQLGMTGIPVTNVNNNCSTGSTALFNGRTLIASGSADCVLCLGFEKMERGSLQSKWSDRVNPLDRFLQITNDTVGIAAAPFACQLFANAGKEYIDKNGGDYDSMAKIAEINHRHSAKNPYSQFKDVYTFDQIKNSPTVYCAGQAEQDSKYNATKLQACPTSDGAAAAVLVSEKFLRLHPELQSNAIEISGQAMTTDTSTTFNKSAINLVGFDMVRRAARKAFDQAGITAKDVQVVELHDCFSANELVSLDALELCEPGKASKLVMDGDITYGGKYVVNPSGGLISKGHPLGATGLAQCAELVWHLRGWATNRAVPKCRNALQHNIGLGGATVVTIYKRPNGSIAPMNLSSTHIDGRTRLGYNPATESHPINMGMVKSVRSKQNHSDFMLQGTRVSNEASL